MASRVVARKPARLIPIFPGEEPYFDTRGKIPVNSANAAQARAGLYRAKLVEIVPVANRAVGWQGGLPEAQLYAWVYRTLRSWDRFWFEDGIDEDGEVYEFVHYTGVELGDPIASLTNHVGGIIGEVPDPEVLEAVGLSRMVGSTVSVLVGHEIYAIPSYQAMIALDYEDSHLRRGPHMVSVRALQGAKPQGVWREELEARERELAAGRRPKEVMVLRITDVEDHEGIAFS